MQRNMFKIIEDTTGTIPTRYDLTIEEYNDLVKSAITDSNGAFGEIVYKAVSGAFKYGFALGSRYEQNKNKKAGGKEQ